MPQPRRVEHRIRGAPLPTRRFCTTPAPHGCGNSLDTQNYGRRSGRRRKATSRADRSHPPARGPDPRPRAPQLRCHRGRRRVAGICGDHASQPDPGSVAEACSSLSPSPLDRHSGSAGHRSHRPTLHYSGRLRANVRASAAHLDDRLGTASDLGAGARASRVYPPRKASSVSTRSHRAETGSGAARLPRPAWSRQSFTER